jgi:hypothetical protein
MDVCATSLKYLPTENRIASNFLSVLIWIFLINVAVMYLTFGYMVS